MIAIWCLLVALQTPAWRIALIGLAILGALLLVALVAILIGFCAIAFRSDTEEKNDDDEDLYTRLEQLSQRERADLAAASRTLPSPLRTKTNATPFSQPASKGFRR